MDGVCYTCDISRNTNENPLITHQPPESSNPSVPKCAKRTLKKKPTDVTSSISRNVQSKRTGSAVTTTETRSSYKKLLNDIDKLVSKSQQEMAAIADEDLNEISKAIKNAPTEIRNNQNGQISRRKVPRVKQIGAKRKVEEINDDPGPVKIPRKIKPPARLVEAFEDAANSNEGQKLARARPSTSGKLTKPRRRAPQTAARPKTRPKRSEKSKQKKLSNNEVNADDTSPQLDPQCNLSDDEYLLGDNFFMNPKRVRINLQFVRIFVSDTFSNYYDYIIESMSLPTKPAEIS